MQYTISILYKTFGILAFFSLLVGLLCVLLHSLQLNSDVGKMEVSRLVTHIGKG